MAVKTPHTAEGQLSSLETLPEWEIERQKRVDVYLDVRTEEKGKGTCKERQGKKRVHK